MVGSFYDPDLDEACAFEELISFHGGLGGPQTRPFILHPAELPLPPDPIVGAAAVHRILLGVPVAGGSPGGTRRAGRTAKLNAWLTAMGEGRQSRLSSVRAAGADRLQRVESAALSRRGTRPLAVMARRAAKHELVDRGAALTYYGVLALVPALLVLFSVIGLFGNQGTIDSVLKIVDEVGPSNGDTVVRDPLTEVVQDDTLLRLPVGHQCDRDHLDRLGLRRFLLPRLCDDLGRRAAARLARVAAADGSHSRDPDPDLDGTAPDHADGAAGQVDRRRAGSVSGTRCSTSTGSPSGPRS